MEVGEHQSMQLNEIRRTIQHLKTEFNKETETLKGIQPEMKMGLKNPIAQLEN